MYGVFVLHPYFSIYRLTMKDEKSSMIEILSGMISLISLYWLIKAIEVGLENYYDEPVALGRLL